MFTVAHTTAAQLTTTIPIRAAFMAAAPIPELGAVRVTVLEEF
jgi:hypothetical protein